MIKQRTILDISTIILFTIIVLSDCIREENIMLLHFSTQNWKPGDKLDPAQDFRYFIILEGTGECYAAHQHFSLSLHDVLALPQNTELRIESDKPILTGCIRVSDMQTPRTHLYHLPGEHTGLLRHLFYLALDILLLYIHMVYCFPSHTALHMNLGIQTTPNLYL